MIMLVAEETDEGATTKRYMSAESLKTVRRAERSAADPRPYIEADRPTLPK